MSVPEAMRHGFVLLTMAVLFATTAGASAGEPEVAPAHESFPIESEAMRETRRINVYLPPPGDAGAGSRYPVLYMPDGGIAEDFPHVARTIDTAIREQRMAPVILVGIENTQRRRDMTGPAEVDKDREIAPVVGGSAAFRAFIADELIPMIDARFPGNGRRGIIGESLAGLFIVESFFVSPGMFDTWIALDPSLWWNGGRLAGGAQSWFAAQPELRGRLYLAWSEPELIAPHARVLAAALKTAAPTGVQWQAVERSDLDHATIYRTLAPEVLPALYPPRSEGR